MKPSFLFIAITMAVLLFSCHGNNDNAVQGESITNDIALPDIDMQKAKAELPNGIMLSDTTTAVNTPGAMPLQAGQPAPPDWNKKIIKNAFVTIEVKNYQQYDQSIHNSLAQYGAYIASEQQLSSNGGFENTVSIKVPVDRFDVLMNALPGKDGTVEEKRITTQDVTGEVVDLKARTEAKKQVRNRYLDLLRQAKNMKDILEVEHEINTIQEDIEAGAGRVQYLLHQSAYSTIQLRYYQLPNGVLPGQTTTFSLQVKEAFNTGAALLSSFVLFLVTIWPFIIIAVVFWLFIKRHSLVSARVIKKV